MYQGVEKSNTRKQKVIFVCHFVVWRIVFWRLPVMELRWFYCFLSLLVVLETACCYNLGAFHNLRLCFSWIIVLCREPCFLNVMYSFVLFSCCCFFILLFFLNFMSPSSWISTECRILQGFFGINCLMISDDIVAFILSLQNNLIVLACELYDFI